ncbi:MAG TPA: hypothetical protein VGM26_07925, partial [Rhizomicrobium sp.]
AGLKWMVWTQADLAKRRKGEAGKVRLAAELRSQTTMPLAWIAARLQMGSRGYLTWLLYRYYSCTKKSGECFEPYVQEKSVTAQCLEKLKPLGITPEQTTDIHALINEGGASFFL